MLAITPFFGDPEKVNPQFIVAAKDCQIVTDIVDTTEHLNYHKTICNKSTTTRYFEIGLEDAIQHDKFKYVADHTALGKGLKPIHVELAKE